MTTTYETFTLERSGPIVTVSFNRPAKLNPLNEQVLREFLALPTSSKRTRTRGLWS